MALSKVLLFFFIVVSVSFIQRARGEAITGRVLQGSIISPQELNQNFSALDQAIDELDVSPTIEIQSSSEFVAGGAHLVSFKIQSVHGIREIGVEGLIEELTGSNLRSLRFAADASEYAWIFRNPQSEFEFAAWVIPEFGYNYTGWSLPTRRQQPRLTVSDVRGQSAAIDFSELGPRKIESEVRSGWYLLEPAVEITKPSECTFGDPEVLTARYALVEDTYYPFAQDPNVTLSTSVRVYSRQDLNGDQLNYESVAGVWFPASSISRELPLTNGNSKLSVVSSDRIEIAVNGGCTVNGVEYEVLVEGTGVFLEECLNFGCPTTRIDGIPFEY
jgi:hypothetical protein